MRYLSILFWACCMTSPGFSQSTQTITLIFISPSNDSHKNYEALIDDVSYYSENNNDATNQDRNTIWLNNVEPGRHAIQVYGIKRGSGNEREVNAPIYSSAFTVRQGYDTRIVVKNNGQVQLSERLSARGGNGSSLTQNDKDSYSTPPITILEIIVPAMIK
jgi:hypothetical protein